CGELLLDSGNRQGKSRLVFHFARFIWGIDYLLVWAMDSYQDCSSTPGALLVRCACWPSAWFVDADEDPSRKTIGHFWRPGNGDHPGIDVQQRAGGDLQPGALRVLQLD